MKIRIERTNASQLTIDSDTENSKAMEQWLRNIIKYIPSKDIYVGKNFNVDFIEAFEAPDGVVFVTTNLGKDACRRLLEDFFDQLTEEESSKICNEK